ncbi:MAG: type II CRISPR RNA-guided endonuclease Cas9, partial [Gemmiger formicilis]|nr:type II CRISPR RNA-guided endonuclease Cas9 [Gemmiger formicilis]
AEAYEKKEKITALPCYHKMRKALNTLRKDHIRNISREQLDAAGAALTNPENEDKLREALKQAEFEPLEIEALLTLPSFAGYGHISVKACRKLIPYLEQGMNYNDACQAAGYDFQGRQNGEKAQFLPASTEEMEDITSPVVRRAVAQTIKVVNAIIREQGESPVSIHLELAREMNKNFQQRSELDKAMRDNSAENERLMKELNELFPGRTVTGQDLVKYRLWKEQDGRCAYSIQPLELDKVITVSGYAEVDHIVPYSISFDDRRTNKVLVLKSENRQKGNRLPLQYLQGKRRDDFIVYAKANVKNFRKRQNLLKERLSEEDGKGYIQRNLQDTQYIAAFMLNYIRNHLAFADCSGAGKRRVVAVNGAVTAFLRKRWGLSKVRADGDLHHAADAAVIACTTQGMIKRVSDFCKRAETTAVRNEHFPEPWPRFRDELRQRLSACPQEDLMKINPVYYATVDISSIQPVFVSRMPRHKVTGAAHEETIRSQVNEQYTAVRKSITELSLDKDGKIKDYFKPRSDTLLYEALKKRLTEFGGNAKKAFAEPFYKPRADGTPGAQVRKVKVVAKMNNTIPVRSGGGVAKGGDMIRIDVYYVPGDGYYWVPIYVADTVKETLPNKAVVRDKTMEEWKEMKEDDFLFSLYSNDLILVERDKPICFSLMHEDSTLPKKYETKKELVYYKGGDISNGGIRIETHEGAYFLKSLTFGIVQKVQKYQVDVLGNYTPVKKEKRQTFPAQRR